jgi:hypothetical protein
MIARGAEHSFPAEKSALRGGPEFTHPTGIGAETLRRLEPFGVWGAKTRSTSRKITDLQPVTEFLTTHSLLISAVAPASGEDAVTAAHPTLHARGFDCPL